MLGTDVPDRGDGEHTAVAGGEPECVEMVGDLGVAAGIEEVPGGWYAGRR